MNINSDLEPLTVYHYEVSPTLDDLVKHVLAVIPDSYAEEFPSFSVFESYSPWGAHVEEGKIFCDSSLLGLPRTLRLGHWLTSLLTYI